MGRFSNPIAASREIHTGTELRQQIYREPSLRRIYAELQQNNYRHLRLWKRDVISPSVRPFPLTQGTKLAAIIVALGFVFWLWFGVSAYHAPRATFPYYDIQKPVPPWSEPMPLEGNYDRGKAHT